MSKPGQRVLAELRKLIASGELAAGERIVEIPTAERLQVSRMPVRIALRTLEQEGLLCKTGRGYRVRAVTREDIAGAVEVRGVLEGLAARQAAERGLSAEARATLEECLAEGDRLFANGQVLLEELERYQRMNMRFHRTIIEASGNPAIAVALARNDHLPFASVSALAVDRDNPSRNSAVSTSPTCSTTRWSTRWSTARGRAPRRSCASTPTRPCATPTTSIRRGRVSPCFTATSPPTRDPAPAVGCANANSRA